jgi:hypothetical protein
MRLNELGLRPATLACLLDAGICTTHELLDHSCREPVWHSEITAAQLHESLCRLNHHRLVLPPRIRSRPPRLPGDRNLEVFRLRVVEGCSLRETGARAGIGSERVRQILSVYFGVIGKPPAVKARRGQQP